MTAHLVIQQSESDAHTYVHVVKISNISKIIVLLLTRKCFEFKHKIMLKMKRFFFNFWTDRYRIIVSNDIKTHFVFFIKKRHCCHGKSSDGPL